MKLPWLAKQILAVLFFLVLSIFISIGAFVEGSGSPHQYSILPIGFMLGFIPITFQFITSYKNGTLFIRDKQVIIERRQKNQKLSKLFIVPGVLFGMVFAYFPESIKLFLLSAMSGFLLPLSIGLALHVLKNHKEIEEITKDL